MSSLSLPAALAAVQSSALPSAASPLVVWVAIGYFVLVAVIAVWASRLTRTRDDFFLAGKRIGLVALTLAAMASTFSGFTFIGGPAFIYDQGLGAILFVLPASITNVLAAWVLAKRLRLLIEVRPLITIPDAIGLRFGSRRAHGLAALGVIVGAIGYMATQVLVMGIVMDALFGLGVPLGIWLGTAIVLAYATGGGILAGIYTDVLQGLIMAVAALLVFVFAMETGGGMGAISRTILAADPEWASPWGVQTTLGAMSLYFLFSAGVLGQPHVMHKFYMIRDPRRLKWYPLLVTIAMLVVILLMVGVGMAVKWLTVTGEMPPLADANFAAPLFLLEYTPALLAAIVFAGMASAVMSTVDSFVNVGAAAITHDLPTVFGRPLSEAGELRWGRITTVLLGLASAALAQAAFASAELVAFLGIFGYGIFAAALAPSLAIGLNWGRATRAGAIASITVGLSSALVLEGLRFLGVFALPAGIGAAALALALSFATFLGVSLLTRGGEATELDEDVQMALRM